MAVFLNLRERDTGKASSYIYSSIETTQFIYEAQAKSLIASVQLACCHLSDLRSWKTSTLNYCSYKLFIKVIGNILHYFTLLVSKGLNS